MVRLLSNCIQRWSIWSYIKKLLMARLTPILHLLTPKSLKCNISMTNCPIALKFNTVVEHQKLPTKSMTRLTPKLHSVTFVSPNSLICNISMTNCPIALKFNTVVEHQKLPTKSMTRLTPKLHSVTFVSPNSLICNISMNNGPIALKFCTEVQSQ